jgi:hypothetical protein
MQNAEKINEEIQECRNAGIKGGFLAALGMINV